MTYQETSRLLSQHFNLTDKEIEIPLLNLKITNHRFVSQHSNLLPGESQYYCAEHDLNFMETEHPEYRIDNPALNEIQMMNDSQIPENRDFTYPVFTSTKQGKSKGLIILLHGLNEKNWDKYLPWAYYLMEQTGSDVLLFPLAFHMNRSLPQWSNPKLMRVVNEAMCQAMPKTNHASFANASISARMHFLPQRFYWSGLQSYFDLLQLLKDIRMGRITSLMKDVQVDFFAYSIGAFLAEILFLTNEDEVFNDSRLFIFCGGPTLNKMYAGSKYILNSEANLAMYAYYLEHLEHELKSDKRLAHYLSEAHPVGIYFRSMLDFNKLTELREKRFKELHKQISVVALRKDKVAPPLEVSNTFKGVENNIGIKVRVLDFPYEYDHVTPFPLKKDSESEVDKAFRKVIKTAVKFFK
jgi:hypothetical protein